MKSMAQNYQAQRIGDISDSERKAAGRAYVNYRRACERAGCWAERFERFLPEWIEVHRAQAIEPEADVEAGCYPRTYGSLQYHGLRGFDHGHHHFWEK